MPSPTTVSARTLTTVAGASVPVPDPDRLIHLQFRRFAGCPICNLHLRSFVARHAELTAANIREVVVFHSSAAELRKYTEDIPLDLIADPTRALYREFGVESSPRALLDPRAWPTILRAVTQVIRTRKTHPAPPSNPEGGRLGLPADFLISPTGQILAAKHGTHAEDQWSVNELLALTPVPAQHHRPPTKS
ncbi:alkyl-hydroperoxide reductase/thiol specific antioxidant family protein [Nocardia tenerifensis]|uniref:Alkyl-hydroperoxide reductase/thiol specific antioxidant family protein n=1 Tax=Nocardia tenerifensis TaxID=228006 RepID=A0A318KUJ9_9NOCA|nr:peroxiredoxin-like family protein [Nocardia tenerifensis]PXX68431.1 alkyl-hydroperoxide reductase/thiol specific antioxidant family protein [Nocardia tenerifensis]